MMLQQKQQRWFFALAVAAVFCLLGAEQILAQSPRGFSKSGRSAGRPASNPNSGANQGNRGGGNRGGNQGRSNRSGGNRGGHAGHNHGNRHGHNNRNVIPSARFGTGHPASLGHYHGYYVPISPYGYNNRIRVGQSFYPYYPNAYGLGYNSFGFNNGGFNNFRYGVNPAYTTYGTYLNNGGVLNSNVIGSSVAAQSMQRLQNQQPILPQAQNANSIRDLEIMRLQIELERARQRLAQSMPAQSMPAQQQTRTMKIPTSAQESSNKNAIDQLGLAPILESNQLSAASQLKAERAFRNGEYGQAARFAGLATSLDESNGKLQLFKSQAHFANGEYAEAVNSLSKANASSSPQDMGWVVENFKLFYGKNDYVSQMQELTSHLKSSDSDSNAWLLRGFQYGALGYPEAAKKDLERAKDLGADGTLVDTLLARFTNKSAVEAK